MHDKYKHIIEKTIQAGNIVMPEKEVIICNTGHWFNNIKNL